MTSAPALSQNTTTRRHGFFRARRHGVERVEAPPRRSRVFVRVARHAPPRLREGLREARGVQDRAAGLVVRDRGRVRDALHGGGGAGVEQVTGQATLQRGSRGGDSSRVDVFSRRPSLAGALFSLVSFHSYGVQLVASRNRRKDRLVIRRVPDGVDLVRERREQRRRDGVLLRFHPGKQIVQPARAQQPLLLVHHVQQRRAGVARDVFVLVARDGLEVRLVVRLPGEVAGVERRRLGAAQTEVRLGARRVGAMRRELPCEQSHPRAPRLRRVRARVAHARGDVRVRRRVAQQRERTRARERAARRARADRLGGGRRARRARRGGGRRARGDHAGEARPREDARARREGRRARRHEGARRVSHGVSREAARRLARSRRKRMALVGFYVGTSASRARATMTKIQDAIDPSRSPRPRGQLRGLWKTLFWKVFWKLTVCCSFPHVRDSTRDDSGSCAQRPARRAATPKRGSARRKTYPRARWRPKRSSRRRPSCVKCACTRV